MKEINALVMCDLEEPRRQRTVVVKGVELSIGLEERVLNDIFTIHYRPGHSGTITVETRPQVSNRFEEREITRLEWTTDIEASQIIHIDLAQPVMVVIRAEQNFSLLKGISDHRH